MFISEIMKIRVDGFRTYRIIRVINLWFFGLILYCKNITAPTPGCVCICGIK